MNFTAMSLGIRQTEWDFSLLVISSGYNFTIPTFVKANRHHLCINFALNLCQTNVSLYQFVSTNELK